MTTRGGLADLPAVRPLHALQLAPASSQERHEAVALARLARAGRRAAARAHDLRAVADVAVGAPGDVLLLFVGGAFLERLLGVVDAVLELLEGRLVALDRGFAGGAVELLGARLGRVDQLGAAERELRVGDVDLAAGELGGLALVQPLKLVLRVSSVRGAVVRRARLSAAGGTCLAVSALLRSSAVAGHGGSSR